MSDLNPLQLPWKVDEDFIVDSEGNQISSYWYPNDKLEKVVTIVNSHTALVEALRECQRQLKNSVNRRFNYPACTKAITAAENALTNATKP